MTVVLCPGQGAQRPGMGRDFAEAFPSARRVFERADEALGFALSRILWEGTEADVNRTDVCQPGILVVTTAIWTAVRERGLAPADVTAFAGLSLGEYTAHHLAGTLSFEDAVRLTRRRGEAMQAASDACPSGMAAVMGIDLDGCERVCAEVRAAGGVVVVANLNAPGQIVISGENRALASAAEKLTAAGAKRVIPLPVAGAFHSPVMEPARAALAEALAAADFRDPSVPVVSNVTAEPVRTAADARATLARQVTSPVLFEKSLRGLLAAGAAAFAEPGPGRTLAGFVKKIDRALPCTGWDAVADLGGAT
ncbi:MAG: Malonyl CoA-acyl carrier protein transacylase [Planctomycetes bacterium]|nr:Malonyl CoA-acyl carrier protein transacylase [Planctomycetota bacterium]